MANLNLPLPDELVEAVDRERGDVPRVRWIRRAIEQRLRRQPDVGGALDSVAGSPRARRSSEVKRDVGPVPKGRS